MVGVLAAADLEPVVAGDPGQEALAGLLMTALYRAGLQSDALDGDPSSARPLFEEAVSGLTRLGTPLCVGHALAGLARCDWCDGLLGDASERYTRVHAAGEQYGEPTLVATGLEGLARVAVSASASQHDAANAQLHQAAEVRQIAARPAPPHEQREIDELWAQVNDAGEGLTVLVGAPRDLRPAGQLTTP